MVRTDHSRATPLYDALDEKSALAPLPAQLRRHPRRKKVSRAPRAFLAPSRPALQQVVIEYHDRLSVPPPTSVMLRSNIILVDGDLTEEEPR